MFQYCSNETVIPSLVFTKAELVYALSVLTADIPPTDNATKIEMVEVRHFLNQDRSLVARAVADGTIRRAMMIDAPPPVPNVAEQPAPRLPSIEELREQFPTLADSEIREIIETAKRQKEKETAERMERKRRNAPPPVAAFLAKPEEPLEQPEPDSAPAFRDSEKDRKNRENSIKFAKMLGNL